jgi:hypothetical protein
VLDTKTDWPTTIGRWTGQTAFMNSVDIQPGVSLLWKVIADELIEILWLGRGDISRTQKNGNICRLKPLPEEW